MRLAPLFALAFATAASSQVPDTLDWRRYYPLAVGNVWEYHDAEGWSVQFRHTLVADTLVGGRTYFVRRTDYSSLGSPAPPATPRLDYVRYDEAGGGVVAVASLSNNASSVRRCTDADLFERDLRLAFGTRLACNGSPPGADSLLVDGQYDAVWQPDVLSGTPVPVAVAAIKQFVAAYVHFTTFVADVGPVRAGNLWGPSLHYAVIDGVAYGTPEMVIEEVGGPLTAIDASVSLPGDLQIAFANLTTTPVALDSLVMHFADPERFISWSIQSIDPPFVNCWFSPEMAPCVPGVTLAPGAVLRFSVGYDPCPICRTEAPAGARRGGAPDTLLVYSGGHPLPDRLLFDDSGYIGTEETPSPVALALTVGPNPVVGAGSVVVTAAEPVRAARVALFDALGRRVALLHDGALPAGVTRLGVPQDLPAGIYLVQADADGLATTARFTVVRWRLAAPVYARDGAPARTRRQPGGADVILQFARRPPMTFELQATCPETGARAGRLTTDHGVIETPVFMPVGTVGSVKAVSPRALRDDIGAQIVLGNTYHLVLRPGRETLVALGGLHRMMAWDGPILTDSGGFQVFSLAGLRKVTDDGVRFRSHLAGDHLTFTPENVVDAQRDIGSDLMMVLDECPPATVDEATARRSNERTVAWAKRAFAHYRATEPRYGHAQALVPIVQGAVHPAVRRESADALTQLGAEAYAIGGLSVGETAEQMYDIVAVVGEILPRDRPRYLMGVGTPQNLIENVARGIDMFDCVMPTRNARNGTIFTTDGLLNIKNARWTTDDAPLDAGLDVYHSRTFSRAYLRHLTVANEPLFMEIASVQNLAFYAWVMREMRAAILDGRFPAWRAEWSARVAQKV